MATELEEITDLAVWPPFRRRIRAAMVKAALDVAAEMPDPNNQERSMRRRALSINVSQELDAYEVRFAIAVAANPVITHESSDNDVQFTVNSVWDAIAGAPPLPSTP